MRCNSSFTRRLQSLSGHQSSVESVIFDREELVVAAGASNGSIKLFELQSARGGPCGWDWGPLLTNNGLPLLVPE